ncbi:AP2/ERF and B3 domain-containing transcription factor At1g51120 [Vitis vinifera]|nr:AP2/ERF and B3 domain-containing transcription factor At1g51120 [Vitis vinifera]
MPTSKRHMIHGEVSDANSYCYTQHARKRTRYENNVSSSSSSSKFKGVVQQQNGNWGAQIYANHQRIWLGTFKSEEEAAMAYDSAAIKLRNGESQRNFPWTNLTVQEPDFQNHYTTEAVLNMIKDGSYSSNFSSFLDRKREEKGVDHNAKVSQGGGGMMWRQLFQKELTPSDVGKLNRLVIPKKYAVKYFPKVSDNGEGNADGSAVDNTRLNFYDRWMRLWKFRYCYWSSSQSFVFTRGWNRFVKEKELKAKDIITFYMCESPKMPHDGQPFCVIDVKRMDGNSEGNGSMVEGVDHALKLDLAQNLNNGTSSEDEVPISQNNLKKGVKLFGVHIS